MSRPARKVTGDNPEAGVFAIQFYHRLRDALEWEAERRGRPRGEVMPQRDFAEALAGALDEEPVSSASVSRWYRGNGMPELYRIPGIAVVLGVSETWLAWGRGEPVPDGLAPSERATRGKGVQRRRADVSAKRVRKTAKRKRA